MPEASNKRILRIVELFSLFATIQVLTQVLAMLIGLENPWPIILGVGVFLLVLIYIFICCTHPAVKQTPHRLSPLIAALLGAVCTVVIIVIAYKCNQIFKPKGEHVIFYADFLAWAPLSDERQTREAKIPLDEAAMVCTTITVYQEAIYLYSYKLRSHIGGCFDDFFIPEERGLVKPDVLYPHTFNFKSHRDNPDRKWTVTIPLKSVDQIIERAHFYNSFYLDNHTYGFTLRLPADTVEVTFDFSRLDLDQVFDTNRPVRLFLVKGPHGHDKQEIPVDSVLWAKGILRATLYNLKFEWGIVLDCVWKK
ncbi:MAG: hypothetical protein GTO24_24240 [candidate division Zixibacteria bacterium]|nr:hypothetical protein [candidate division Zixibacteria bacterium]